MWDAIKEAIFAVLLQIEAFTGDWGLAIIILTILIRLVLWPLTAKQVKSTLAMQKVTPEIKKIQEKYKDDKEKQQEELMKFYSENKVNPFASCLPMLLQMPIFIALYQVLGGTPDKPGLLMEHLDKNGVGSFFGIIPNISKSAADLFGSGDYLGFIPYLLLVIVFGLSIWLPQIMTPGAEKQQKMMGLWMGAFMLFIGWSVPAGVLLYWDTSSILGIGQQYLTQTALKKAMEHEEAAEEAAKLAAAEEKAAKRELAAGKKSKKK